MGSIYRGESRALVEPRFAGTRFGPARRTRRPPASTRIRNSSTTTRIAALALAALCVGLLVYLVVLAAGPSISSVTPVANSSTQPGTVSVGATVTSTVKPIKQIVLSIDGAPVQPAVEVRNAKLWVVHFTSEFPRGTHTVRLQVTDTAGRTDQHSWSFQAAGPRIAPTLAFTGPPAGETLVPGQLRVSAQVVADGDIKSVTMTVNGKDTPASFVPDPAHIVKLGNGNQGQTWTVFSDPTLAAGNYLVHIAAVDANGSTSSTDLRFSVAADPAKATARYFSATNQYLRGPFKAFWEAHDGAFMFGNPLGTEIVNDQGVTVQ